MKNKVPENVANIEGILSFILKTELFMCKRAYLQIKKELN